MAGRSPFFSKQNPGGLFVVSDLGYRTGDHYFVNSATGVDAAGNGINPDAPFKTVAYAVTQCTSDNEDTVHVMPGHTESITAAGTIAMALNGIEVLGHGRGRKRPVFTWTTATGATITSAGTNNGFRNCIFDLTGFAAVVTGFNIAGSDFTLDGCEVICTTSTNQAGVALTTTSAANRLTVQNCRFLGTTDAGMTTALKIVGGDGHLIQNNVFIGAYTTTLGAIQNVTTACTNAVVLNNRIWNRTASSTVCMTFVSTSTGMIIGNTLQILSGTAPIVAAAMSWAGGNYYAATIATGSTLV